MARYEYQYTDFDGKTRVVERSYPMGKAPKHIMVDDQDEVYRADRIISLTASMASNWRVKDTDSTLPPENSPIL